MATTVTVTSASPSMTVGQTLQLSVTVKDQTGAVMTDQQVTWTLAPDSVGTVNATGLLTAVRAGTATATAAVGGKSGDVQVEIDPAAAPVVVGSITIAPAPGDLMPGQIIVLQATVMDPNGVTLTGVALTWTSSDPLTASVAYNGALITLKPGDVTITATADGKTTTVVVSVYPLTFVQTSGGNDTACGLTTSGLLYCWGATGGSYAVAGEHNVPAVSGPFPTPGWKAIAMPQPSGNQFVCGLTATGASYCFGFNGTGQLGVGDVTARSAPTPTVGGLSFAQISAGSRSVCGVTTSQLAYCWGWNASGQIGTGDSVDVHSPMQIGGALHFSQISAGLDHTCAIATTGEAYCWGSNGSGQLGTGDTQPRAVPTAVSGGLTFQAIAAGASYTCGVTVAGAGYCWGEGRFGQLGNAMPLVGGQWPDALQPSAIAGGLSFRTISVTSNTDTERRTCGITTGGDGYCWGSGPLGNAQLIVGNPSPLLIAGGITFATIDVSPFHSCGISTAGATYCWGYNQHGSLGVGDNQDRDLPTKIVWQP